MNTSVFGRSTDIVLMSRSDGADGFPTQSFIRLTFFHSAATCLHVPARLTRESTKHEGRKPRASERHVVGCCEELGGGPQRCVLPRLASDSVVFGMTADPAPENTVFYFGTERAIVQTDSH